ncbi:hypothetical protein GGI07_003257 [Coemansia sp. Benny D115]|nr:hypothetical protein GGI07_003257 [Coemansia sp. Benny D115]
MTDSLNSTTEARRSEYWRTLLAMGFDVQAACSGAYSGVQLDERVFETGIYHVKAAELMLHFMFQRLDAARLRREFLDCWPIGDARQAREFRAHAFRWLDELRRDARWPATVPVRRSFVDEARGVRFEAVLWTLARLTAATMLRGVWSGLLAHPLRSEGDASQLDACRRRYARRTRDRLRAQREWVAAQRAMEDAAADARQQRDAVHLAYRACRRRVAGAQVPAPEATLSDVAQALSAAAGEARALWAASSGWVERNGDVIAAVDAVLDERANAVVLSGREHVRLAPSSQMAGEWARWMDTHGVQPFSGARVDLNAVARMATACVAALGAALGSQTPPSLDCRAGPTVLPPGVTAELEQTKLALAEQEVRLARLRRLRARLTEQRAAAARLLPPSEPCGALDADEAPGLVGARLVDAAREPVGPASEPAAAALGGSRGLRGPRRLARVWERLGEDGLGAEADDIDDDESVLGSRASSSLGLGSGLSRLSLARGSITPSPTEKAVSAFPSAVSRKRMFDMTPVASVKRMAKRKSIIDELEGAGVDMLVDEEMPDFLVS